MAIAKITITCTTCGKVFEHRKECHTRKEADSYESWAADHIDTCPECHAKQVAKQKADKVVAVLEKFGCQLPELIGASEKQIAYAVKVRNQYLYDNISSLQRYLKMMRILDDAEQAAAFARVCEEHGTTVEEGIQQNIEAMHLTTIQLMLTSTNAREVLDYKS